MSPRNLIQQRLQRLLELLQLLLRLCELAGKGVVLRLQRADGAVACGDRLTKRRVLRLKRPDILPQAVCGLGLRGQVPLQRAYGFAPCRNCLVERPAP